jgi:competence protein ComEA
MAKGRFAFLNALGLGAGMAAPLLLAGGQPGRAAPAADPSDEPPALRQVCGRCHNTEIVTNTPRSLDDWRNTVQQMVDRGATGSDDQLDAVFDYLHRTLTTIDVNTADADELGIVLGIPDSVAQAIVAHRTRGKIRSLDELKAVTGVDARVVDAKARMIFF